MKKTISLILSILIAFSSISFCITALAVKTTDVPKTRLGTSETFYEFNVQTKTLTISGNGAIPNMLNNDDSQPWTTWRSDGSIERVVIEEGITSIGNYVLYYVCAKEVSLPTTLKSIGNYALAYNSEIEEYEIPFGVKTLGASSFENCISLKRIHLPDTLATISKNAFKQCYKLESVNIPYSVTSIGNYAFYRCSVLSDVHFESLSSYVRIGNYVFKSCPLLTELSVPLNATVGKLFYGFNDSDVKYENAHMKLFSGSDALTFAVTKAIPYNVLDYIPIELGAVNANEYMEDTFLYQYKYSFIPETTQVYNIYSTGGVDLTAVLSDGSGELQRSEDISEHNLNFCLTYEMEAGREYVITVTTERSEGEYAVIAYPDNILGVDVTGSLAFGAEDGSEGYFEITEDMLSGFVLDVEFEGGYSDKIYYSSGYFDNKQIMLADKQKEAPFTCGSNSSYISIGETLGEFVVYIEHSYGETVVEYTVDDDGYTIFTCVLCGDTYKGNFVPTPAVTVSGKAVLMQTPGGSHIDNIAYPYVSFFANNRTYYTDENGNWSVNTFDDLDLVFKNENGKDVSVHIDVDGENVDFGAVAFEGYDFDSNNTVNAKDFAIFIREKQKNFGKEYWKYAVNFL